MKGKAPIAEAAKQGLGVAGVAGIPISHPAKIWFPAERITKVQVAQYYAAVAPRMLPWLNHRLLTVERCPDGITAGCFFEKNFVKGLPAGVPTCSVPAESTGKTVHYVVGGAKETLLALVNLGSVAIHIMNCETGSLDRPDWLAFDLDPSSGEFRDAAAAAGVLRKLLEELRLRSFPKTTGGRGLHVLVPLRRGPDQEQVLLVAHNLSQEIARRSPVTITVQALIQEWIQFIRRPKARRHAIFLSDYDMLLTERLVQGVDVWINTPRRPWEASGTSGMKVLVNGGLNLSELDGWWAEAYTPEVGWALGDSKEHGEDPAWDTAEAEALYERLEREVIPEFYSRDEQGVPAAWVAGMRESMARLTPHSSGVLVPLEADRILWQR